jgi:PIN domain nuclease of toxin-antitoxin system
MAAVVYLDTHVVAWLFAGTADLLSTRARHLIRTHDLLVSPMVRLELQLLHAIGRARVGAEAVIGDLRRSVGLNLCARPFGQVIEKAETFSWTRDPFDRVIVAQAAIGKDLLITKDKALLKHYRNAVWE